MTTKKPAQKVKPAHKETGLEALKRSVAALEHVNGGTEMSADPTVFTLTIKLSEERQETFLETWTVTENEDPTNCILIDAHGKNEDGSDWRDTFLLSLAEARVFAEMLRMTIDQCAQGMERAEERKRSLTAMNRAA